MSLPTMMIVFEKAIPRSRSLALASRGAPHKLLVGVVPGVGAFYHPAVRRPERCRLTLLGDHPLKPARSCKSRRGTFSSRRPDRGLLSPARAVLPTLAGHPG